MNRMKMLFLFPGNIDPVIPAACPAMIMNIIAKDGQAFFFGSATVGTFKSGIIFIGSYNCQASAIRTFDTEA